MAESIVQKKSARLIHETLSSILGNEIQLFPGRMLTVSLVRISPDLGHAKVYITVFPDNEMDEVIKQLNKENWQIRKSLAARIKNKMRRIPELVFLEDDSFKEADKISRLLDQIEIPPSEDAVE